jgi:hypothetical protein
MCEAAFGTRFGASNDRAEQKPLKRKQAVLVTTRNAVRDGNIAIVWLRIEYRDSQGGEGGIDYRSAVERSQFDCLNRSTRLASAVYYSENNLGGQSESFSFDNHRWLPIIPGSRGDDWIDWACRITAQKK